MNKDQATLILAALNLVEESQRTASLDETLGTEFENTEYWNVVIAETMALIKEVS